MNIKNIFRFWRYKYKYYKKLGLKFWEAYGWYEKLFHAWQVTEWKEVGANPEEAWWARLYDIKPKNWKSLSKKILTIAYAFPIAPDGIAGRYRGKLKSDVDIMNMVRKAIGRDLTDKELVDFKDGIIFIEGNTLRYNNNPGGSPIYDADLDGGK